MNPDPFRLIDAADMDKDTLTRLAWLAVMARENEIQFQVVHGWVLPLASLPWTPARATALRRCLHHTERARGILQEHARVFPSMTRPEAAEWVDQLHRHHGADGLPSWWSPSVAAVARQIINYSRRL